MRGGSGDAGGGQARLRPARRRRLRIFTRSKRGIVIHRIFQPGLARAVR